MVANDPPESAAPDGNANPSDELGPELLEAVHAVLRHEPPTDWAEESLERLRQRGRPSPPRKSLRVAVRIVLAVAACVVVVLLVGRSWLADNSPETVDDASERRKGTPMLPPSDLTGPTLWAYREAAQQSPEALDELLDRHARQLLRPSSEAELAALWQELL